MLIQRAIFFLTELSSNPSQTAIVAKVKSVQQTKKEKSLDYMAVREYCSKVFDFQEITIRKFK